MAAAAGVEFFQHRLGMRTAVTFGTSLDGFVFAGMAPGAVKPGVFGVAFLQHLLGLAMTESAGGIGCSFGICDFQCLVRGVTGETLGQWSGAGHHLSRCRHGAGVGLVTLKAARYISMLGMVTGRTVEVRMAGGKCFHLLVQGGMTDIASLGKGSAGWNGKRGMGFLVATAAVDKFLAVRMLMASGALRQDLAVTGFFVQVDMELKMALSAVNPAVHGVCIPQQSGNLRMALHALYSG